MQKRKADLLADAAVLLDALATLGTAGRDPYTDENVLAQAVEIGLLDAQGELILDYPFSARI
ncbi:MAG: hypothetical protein K2R98_04730 [Gemmataceae bacterium]|nr:hypothetical protein [Gemmataceae bacterium]